MTYNDARDDWRYWAALFFALAFFGVGIEAISTCRDDPQPTAPATSIYPQGRPTE